MMEIFKDYSTFDDMPKSYTMIPKREYNPRISAVNNMILDLSDFYERVRPMSNDIARVEQSFKH
jgi:hypothetical protein